MTTNGPTTPKNRKEWRAEIGAAKKIEEVTRKKLAHMHRVAGKHVKRVRIEMTKKLDACVEDFFAPKTSTGG